jgi:hypothetical protein
LGCRHAPGGQEAERSDKTEAGRRVEPKEGHHDPQGTGTSTDKIGGVHLSDTGARS